MLSVDLSKCTGCRRCETACAFYHSGRINRYISRVKVINLFEIGVDGPLVCNQCRERYCMCCPEEALSLGNLGQVIVSPTACTLCGACEKACPMGTIEIFRDLVYVCDLCGGNPKCVSACTEKALTFVRDNMKPPSLAGVKDNTKKMTPVQKRHYFLKLQGNELRKKWNKKND